MTSVLMTVDAVGGVWTYALDLADALAPHGVDVVLATMGPEMSRHQRTAATASAVVDVHESTFPLEWMERPWTGVDAAGDWLLALVAAVQPDVIHLNGYVHAALTWPAPTVVFAHSCVLSWWEAVHGVEAPPEFKEYRSRVRAGIAAAGAVAAPTQAMLDALRRWHGLEAGVVIPNGRRADWVRTGPKAPLVLSAGRLWDEAKNAAAVDRAAARLPWPVAIAGPTRDPGGRGWSPRHAVLLGRLDGDALADWLRLAAIFALPARYEPFGLGPLEAGLSGCALVLGDIASLREVWADAAIFVDPFDDDDLVDACRELIDDPDRRERMGARARERARAFPPERAAAGHIALYDQVRGTASPMVAGR
ncbi:MAG: glycosyl transferase family 1 [Acidimicrobiales bacterium]|nr:glycosyl transferase family 1 [Acidimicrobiales bacterium]